MNSKIFILIRVNTIQYVEDIYREIFKTLLDELEENLKNRETIANFISKFNE